MAAVQRWSWRVTQCGLLAGSYLVLSGQTSRDEIVAAGLIALAAALLGTMLRLTSDRALSLQGVRWFRLGSRTLLRVGDDVVRVGAVLLSRHPTAGTFRRQTCDSGPERLAAPAGWRAVAVLATSLTPNRFVVSDLPAHSELLVHQLAAQPESEP